MLRDSGGLGSRIASEFNGSAIGLDEQPPDECDGIVLVVGADPAPSSRPLIDTTEAEWRDVAEGAPLRAMRALQRARRVTLAQCGNIVVIAPSVGLIGAGGLSPYVAGIEAIRAMAKSAARQWAADRISVSLIVVPLGLIVSAAGDLVPHVGRGARKDADLLDAVVRAVRFNVAWWPLALISPVTTSPLFPREPTNTCAPAAAEARAIPRPTPPPAPVTSTVSPPNVTAPSPRHRRPPGSSR